LKTPYRILHLCIIKTAKNKTQLIHFQPSKQKIQSHEKANLKTRPKNRQNRHFISRSNEQPPGRKRYLHLQAQSGIGQQRNTDYLTDVLKSYLYKQNRMKALLSSDFVCKVLYKVLLLNFYNSVKGQTSAWRTVPSFLIS